MKQINMLLVLAAGFCFTSKAQDKLGQGFSGLKFIPAESNF
jgi:hypothetical protein